MTLPNINFGFDLDGILVPLDEFQFEEGLPYFQEFAEKNKEYNFVFNSEEYDIQDIFGCSKSKRNAFWSTRIWSYCLFYKAREYASELIRQVNEDGDIPYLITSKVYVVPEYESNASLFEKAYKQLLAPIFRSMVYYWLDRMDVAIKKENIYFCPEKNSASTKTSILLDKKIPIMMEDKKNNCLAMAEAGIEVICLDAPYNKFTLYEEHPRIVVVPNLKAGYIESQEIKRRLYRNGL